MLGGSTLREDVTLPSRAGSYPQFLGGGSYRPSPDLRPFCDSHPRTSLLLTLCLQVPPLPSPASPAKHPLRWTTASRDASEDRPRLRSKVPDLLFRRRPLPDPTAPPALCPTPPTLGGFGDPSSVTSSLPVRSAVSCRLKGSLLPRNPSSDSGRGAPFSPPPSSPPSASREHESSEVLGGASPVATNALSAAPSPHRRPCDDAPAPAAALRPCAAGRVPRARLLLGPRAAEEGPEASAAGHGRWTLEVGGVAAVPGPLEKVAGKVPLTAKLSHVKEQDTQNKNRKRRSSVIQYLPRSPKR